MVAIVGKLATVDDPNDVHGRLFKPIEGLITINCETLSDLFPDATPIDIPESKIPRIICIGIGAGGIQFALALKRMIPNAFSHLKIFERNPVCTDGDLADCRFMVELGMITSIPGWRVIFPHICVCSRSFLC